MAKLILKSPYYKPNSRFNFGNYVNYIGTRDGVVKTINPKRNEPASAKQMNLIEEMLQSFPNAKNTFEYEDYMQSKSLGNAHDLINYIIDNEMVDRSKYVSYIAQRPRVEKYSSHGLFSSSDEPISLSKVGKEVAEVNSNVWTHIISLKREDAERLGYNNVEAWRNLLKTHANKIAKEMHIEPSNFRWYAAFHNEGHHPHVHMIAYSVKPNEAFLSKKGIENIRSTLARDIFQQDLLNIYIAKDEQREKLKATAKELLNDIVTRINTNTFEDVQIEKLLIEIADRLSKTTGKMQYGYLKPEIKNLIDEVVDLISKEDKISDLYEEWYQKKIETIQIYTDAVPEKQRMSEVKDFKPIKNMVVQMALEIKYDMAEIDKLNLEEIKKKNPREYVDYLNERFYDGDVTAAYLLGRYYATEGSEQYNADLASQFYLYAGDNGNPHGYYQLARMYYFGAEDFEIDLDKANEYLQIASNQGNESANAISNSTPSLHLLRKAITSIYVLC